MKLKIPEALRARLTDAARANQYKSGAELAERLVSRGLKPELQPNDPPQVEAQLTVVCARRGYASVDELIEHLLERGLAAYEAPEEGEDLEKRLRGLGYID